MNFKGVIFDLDGVLCFTDRYHYRAWKALADRLGIYFDEKINDRLRGVSRAASLEIILEGSERVYSQEEKERFAAEKNETYRALLKDMAPADVSASVRDTLVRLREAGVLLAVGSSSKNTPLILEKTDVARIIGRNGMTASAIRSLAKAAGEKNGIKVIVHMLSHEEAAEQA